MTTRGIRNNNPLNIRRGGSQWQGLRKPQSDMHFCQFAAMSYGWRAAFILLTRTYYHKYRLFTIRRIIERWAPPRENNTEEYVKQVARMMNYDADMPLGIPSVDYCRWMRLGYAMAIVENGMACAGMLDPNDMIRGWELARNTNGNC